MMDEIQVDHEGLTRRAFLRRLGAGTLSIATLGRSLAVGENIVANRKPNILFVMTDHQRSDSIGMSQAGVEVCPNLNRLASQGVVFSRAYDACPICDQPVQPWLQANTPPRTVLFSTTGAGRAQVITNLFINV